MAARLVEGINNHEKLSKYTFNKYEKVSHSVESILSNLVERVAKCYFQCVEKLWCLQEYHLLCITVISFPYDVMILNR